MTTPALPKTDVRIEESPQALAADAADMFVDLTREAVAQKGVCRVCLSGGTTPRLLYGLLASDTFRHDVPWDAVRFFFSDERWVPPTHRDSNYKLANDELFSKVGVDPSHVFPVPTEGVTPGQAATQYEETIRREFGVPDGLPVFDLVLLGMGEDGHTASCFPYTEAVHQRVQLVFANYVEKLAAYRVTLTPPVLLAARMVLFLVTGEGKADALAAVLEGDYDPVEYPAQMLRGAEGQVIWLVDKAAAAKLKREYREV